MTLQFNEVFMSEITKVKLENSIKLAMSFVDQAIVKNKTKDPAVDKVAAAGDRLAKLLKRAHTNGEILSSKYTKVAHAITADVEMIEKASNSGSDWFVDDREEHKEASDEKEAAGAQGAAFTTDRDEKGQPKPLEKAEVPRLANKKEAAKPKEEVEPIEDEADIDAIPVEGEEPPVEPDMNDELAGPSQIAPEPVNPFTAWSSEALAAATKALAGLKEFNTDKAAQKAIAQINEELIKRPIAVEEPKAASLKKAVAVPAVNQDSASLEEGSIEEVNKAHGVVDGKYPGVDIPKTELPSKFAGEMATSSAAKKAEDFQEKLKALYLDAKPLTAVNDSRPVREAVESIYAAMHQFGEACKLLSRQAEQESQEAEAQMINDKKKSSWKSPFFGLNLAQEE
jgi:hypothetical protein